MMEAKIKNCSITFESGLPGLMDEMACNCHILTDENVHRCYGHLMPQGRAIIIPAGESSKNLQTVESVIKQLLAAGADRKSRLIGFGGGVVTDITGFVASIYMRGIDFSFIPTTLLAMADASIGGKNGVDIGPFKNMAGTITQPRAVRIYPELLATLPKVELSCGMAEVIKSAIISGEKQFRKLEELELAFEDPDFEALADVIFDAVSPKASIVEKDERETGERKKLNLGHTFAHAIEVSHEMPHGEAVAVGLAAAARVSESLGIASPEIRKRVEGLLGKFLLPTRISAKRDDLKGFILKDKKGSAGNIDFVVMADIGKVEVTNLPVDVLLSLMEEK